LAAAAAGAASLAAGAAVCAKAPPISRKEATAVAVASEEIFVMGHLMRGKRPKRRAAMLNLG
jgi:hypothetical protein